MTTHPCHHCGAVEPLDRAIDAGWIPSFWDGEMEVLEPVCPPCQAAHEIAYDHATGDYGTPTPNDGPRPLIVRAARKSLLPPPPSGGAAFPK